MGAPLFAAMLAALLAAFPVLWLIAEANSPTPRQFVTHFNRRYPCSSYTVMPVHITAAADKSCKPIAKLLNFDFHMARLATTESVVTDLIRKRINLDISDCKFGEGSMFTGVATICCASSGAGETDVLLTEMKSIDYKTSTTSLTTGASTPPPTTTPLFAVNLSTHLRSLPALKPCSWPEERVGIELHRQSLNALGTLPYFVNDTVLASGDCLGADCRLLEGLTSSIIMLSHDAVTGDTEASLAADGSALSGSMADIVAKVSASLGYTVNRGGISLSRLAARDSGYGSKNGAVTSGVFLSSATNIVQKIDVIYNTRQREVYNKLWLPSNTIDEKIDYLHYKTVEYICDNDAMWRTIRLG